MTWTKSFNTGSDGKIKREKIIRRRLINTFRCVETSLFSQSTMNSTCVCLLSAIGNRRRLLPAHNGLQTHGKRVSNQTVTKLNTVFNNTSAAAKRMSNEKNKLNDTKFIMSTVKLVFESVMCMFCPARWPKKKTQAGNQTSAIGRPGKELISWRVNISHRLRLTSSSSDSCTSYQHAHFLSHSASTHVSGISALSDHFSFAESFVYIHTIRLEFL